MTTRDEAKKLADKYAADNKSVHGCIECEDGGYSSEDDLVKAWMACFDALTKGDPDAWALQETDEDSAVKWVNMDIQFNRGDLSFYKEDHPNWRIVPVKILELEGVV